MTQVIVDADTLAKLHGLTAPLDFVDEHGHRLGHFEPHPEETESIYPELGISLEELHRRAEHFDGRSLSHLLEVWEKRK